MEKIIIVGGVAAGATAAAKVRRLSSDASITMFEAGPDISFANCGLPYYIGGDIKSRSKLILQSPESFNEQYQVDVHVNTRITNIDRQNKTVTSLNVRTGEIRNHKYDKLLLAQGGRPIKPRIEGADLDHVYTLWTLNDMDNIQRHIEEKSPKNAVVIGGGFIGLEMVEALVKRGLNVHLVEMMPHVMSVMDAETAGYIEQEMLSYGVNIHTGKSVTGIKPKSVKLNDGTIINSDMVLMSIGVSPTLQLATDSGLEIGESGGLLVNEYLQTSDEHIYAAGDMVEVENRVSGKRVRIPLAGPANRQGRIAAENIMGGKHTYNGAMGTSILRVFEAVAGITGLSLKQALAEGIPANAIVVHKEHHTSYYPGAENVSVMLVYNSETGAVLGGQTAGYKGADRRLDVIASAIAGNLTIHDLADIDFAYSPPLGTANDVINMAAYTAENQKSGFSPSITVGELDEWVKVQKPIVIDVRDMFSFEKGNIVGAYNVPLEMLHEELKAIPKDSNILVYDETGKKGHQALRMLKNSGVDNVYNISGGFISLQRQAYATGFQNFRVNLPKVEKKTVDKNNEDIVIDEKKNSYINTNSNTPLVVDVRTPMEFSGGAYPNAINISLDELETRIDELGSKDRDITLYCASGARSAYAQQLLRQMGYTNVKNGGGLMQMMRKR
ncbi:MAG: FAD-dependent oxidoreductase [Fermentimonas sp.]|nr:FAD-dependent oxidoreductase [Fermentimonas sp.]MDD2931967.1 FAD-dependent oxidoreductase [Fermentimonas sp.]MDD3188955.1 FAD-dependent oxidoreductase [Fermentimonas sp.]MDD4283408.1 FAD-dependent oxidoreductase [Fermentimonas sp.]MDD4724104.1 FAD-dependent oxidoreductase [Fermentimonas sp.]